MTESKGMPLFGAIAVIVGLIIGSAIFVLLPQVTGISGPSVWIAYALSGIPTLAAAFYLLQLGGAIPVSGAHYVGITKWISPFFGFVAAFTGLLCLLFFTPLVSLGFGEYVKAFLPWVDVKLAAIILVGLFCIVNYFGLRFLTIVQVIMFLALLLGMFIFIFGGIFQGIPENRVPLFPNGVGNFVIAIAIATNSWLGILAVTEIAGIVRNPRRNIPIAMLVAIATVAFLYVAMAYTFSGVMNYKAAETAGPKGVLLAAASFLPGMLVNVVALGAMMAMTTSINGFIVLATSLLEPMAKNRTVPGFVMARNRRFDSPGPAILIFFALSCVMILGFGTRLEKYALMSVVGLMLLQFMGATAVFRMPKKDPAVFKSAVFRFKPFWRVLTWIVCTVVFWGLIGFCFLADYKVSLLVLVLVFISAGYWYARKGYLKGKGVELESVITKSNNEIVSACIKGQN
jgi:basic amino acid/polyamine antiporter, APA family